MVLLMLLAIGFKFFIVINSSLYWSLDAHLTFIQFVFEIDEDDSLFKMCNEQKSLS